ncbi:MAG TPA: hypothetical protein VJ992_11160 [Gemmatimonadales bacterium]|nr:hypothetical protein [Gemmatimonadales bacterium]
MSLVAARPWPPRQAPLGGQSTAHEAGEAAFDAAREVLTRTGPAETDVSNQQHQRLALLEGACGTARGSGHEAQNGFEQRRRFRLNRASTRNARWIADTLTREGGLLNTRLELTSDGTFELRWS